MGRLKKLMAVALGWWVTAQSGSVAAPPPRTLTSLNLEPTAAQVQPGSPVRVPEVDPGASAGALTLLVGGLLTLFDRRSNNAPRKRPPA